MPSAYDTLTEVLITTLGRPAAAVTPESTLGGLHLDSLALVELSVCLTERLGVQVTGVDPHKTVAELVDEIDRQIAQCHDEAAATS